MASIYDLKPAFQGLLRPLTNSLAAHHVTANQVTLSALFVSALSGSLIALYPEQSWALLVIPVVLFVRMALNAIDGMLAREHNMKSDLGAFLNELGDVLSDTALYLPFALIPGISPTLVVLLVITSIVVEMTGVVSVMIGAERRYDGPMGKSDRAFVFGLLSLLLGLGVTAGLWSTLLLTAVLLLSITTIYRRIGSALAQTKLSSVKGE